jgi:hypothetical protein
MCACGKSRSNDKCILGLSLEFVREKALVIFPTHVIIPGSFFCFKQPSVDNEFYMLDLRHRTSSIFKNRF